MESENEEQTQDVDDTSPLEDEQPFVPIEERVLAIPLLPPQEMNQALTTLGYKGQEEARRSLCLFAYRHIRRLQRVFLDQVDVTLLPPKQNLLFVGPSGCGKTYLLELLFREILALPTTIIDITSFSETGYIGDDVRSILTRLMMAADGDPVFAMCGIICLDEFDKIASSNSGNRYAGQGTTKDVSGYGVQRELLKMIEGAEILAPVELGISDYGHRIELSTRTVPFVACGAFSGIELIQRAGIGFGSGMLKDRIGVVEDPETLQKYGFLPELLGRFSRIVHFPPLAPETLRSILEENIIPRFQDEFAYEQLQLEVQREALDLVVTRALKRRSGARGLHAELIGVIEKCAYDCFAVESGRHVVITAKDDQLVGSIN